MKFWPYEPLNPEKQRKGVMAVPDSQGDFMLQNMNMLSVKGKQKSEAEKKKERELKKKQLEQGLNNFQMEMRNSNLWVAFYEKIDAKIKFLHLRKFMIFLRREIRVLRKPKAKPGRSPKVKFHKAVIDPVREDLDVPTFDDEYRQFMTFNTQNLK